MLDNKTFYFKQFAVRHEFSSMKVGFDGILLGAWCNVTNSDAILDIGTGSGLLALMAAQKNSIAIIDAIEPDKKSFDEATSNFLNSSWSNRLSAVNLSLQEFSVFSKRKYDHIICNPPFFSDSLPPKDTRYMNSKHTTHLNHIELLKYSAEILKNDGNLSVILPYIESLAFIEKGKAFNLKLSRYCDVRTKKVERTLIELTNGPSLKFNKSVLQIYKAGNEYSDEYTELVKEFYLKL
jgi:tRNA1Val (adenine37-N6)-methyltransferase